MRHLLTALLALVAAPAAAEGTYLQSSSLECAALEATVHYGLVDGSLESTASALTDLMGLNGGAACLEELVSYGYGDWVYDQDCVDAMALIRFQGARPRSGLSPQEIVVRVLTDSDDYLCHRMAIRADDYDVEVDDPSDGSTDGEGEDDGEEGVTG